MSLLPAFWRSRPDVPEPSVESGRTGARPIRPIRVVDICNVSSSANTMLRRRVLAMRAEGMDNRIICIDGPYVPVLEAAGIPVFTARLTRGFDLVGVAVSFVQIYRYLRRENIDLVHTHFSVPGFVGRAAAWLARVPVIVHTIHGFPYHAHSSWAQRAFYIMLERAVGGIADVVLSQNRGNLEEAVEHGIVPVERLRFIGNGIALERFRPSPRPPAEGRPVQIACVARHEMVKNHAMLFKAARLLQDRGVDFRLALVGEGELREQNEAMCRELGIAGRVDFLGYREDIPQILAQSDIVTLTSLKEGVPRALLEGMAMGLPVVATRITGNVDAVYDGQNGYTVEVDDATALADRFAELARDPDLRARMGRRGREIVERDFDEEAIIEALALLYRSMLLQKGIVGSPGVPRVVIS